MPDARRTRRTDPTPRDRPHGLVTWGTIPGKGRGVIARVDCAEGTELERSPVIVVPAEDLLDHAHRDTVPDHYLLYWSDEPGKELAMGCGLLMIYNHSGSPNVEIDDGPEPETMSVTALRDIRAGEELTYDYGVPLWFRDAVADERAPKKKPAKSKRRSR